jgi:OTU domain-containing protein 3
MGKSGGKKKKKSNGTTTTNNNNNNNNNNRGSNNQQQKKNHHRKNNNSHYNNNNNNKETSSEDMAVLREQLDRVNLALKDVSADGNCFFRAICDQRDGSEIHHLDLRHEVCEYMEKHEEDFRPFVEDDEEWSAYLARMRKDGSWAGNMEVQACARLLKMRICVHRAGQPRWVLSPYFNDGESSNGEKKKNANNNNNEEIMDEDCAYHLAYDADRGCEHYNSARMVGTIDSDFPGGPISLRLITDAESEIFEIAQKTGFARDIGRVRRHFKKAIEEGRKLENMSHEEVIDFACESLMAELEKERKERDSLSFGGGGGENEDATEKNAQYADEFEDDFGGGGGWERAKTKREKRRGKSKSLLAEEYEALTL